jgi:hypothetical protein
MANPPQPNDTSGISEKNLENFKTLTKQIDILREQMKGMDNDLKSSAKVLVESFEKLDDMIRAAREGFKGNEILERLGRTAEAVFKKAVDEEIRLTQEGLKNAQEIFEKKRELDQANDELRKQQLREEIETLKQAAKLNNESLKKEQENLLKLKNLSEQYRNNILGVAQSYLKIKDLSKTGFTSLFETIESGGVKMTKLRLMFNETVEAMKTLFSPTNLLNNLLAGMASSIASAVKEWDEQINAFEKATGLGEVYNDLVFDLSRNNLDLGVSFQTSAQAVGVFLNEFAGFSKLTDDTKTQVAETAFVMDRLGVSFQDFSKTASFMMDTLGQSFESVNKFRGEAMALADDLGIPLQQVFKGFNEAAPKLAKWGEQSTEVFKKLVVQAKALKMSTSELLNVVEGFDTFDNAVPKVARLNAVLGGPYLNTIELMKMKENERAEAMVKAFHASGKVWESLSAQEKQAIARAAGINDMTTATKMFTQSIDEYRSSLGKQAVDEEEAKKRAEATMNITEKMNSIFSALAVIIRPIVAVIDAVLSAFLKINDFLRGKLPELLLGVLTFTVFFKKIKEFFNKDGEESVGIISKIMTKIKEVFKKGAGGVIDSVKEVGGKFINAVKDFLPNVGKVLGTMIEGIAGVIKTAGTALVNALGTLGASLLANAIFILGGAAVIAAAIAIISLGLKALAWGIEAVDEAFSGVGKEQKRVDMIKDMLEFGDAEKRLEGLSAGLEKVVDSFTKFGNISSDAIDNSKTILESLKSNLPELSQMTVKAQVVPFLESLGKVVTPLAVTSESSAKVLQSVKTEIKEIAAIKPDKQTIEALKELANVMKATSETKPMTFTAQIDDHVLAKFVTKSVNSTIMPNTPAGKTIAPTQ